MTDIKNKIHAIPSSRTHTGEVEPVLYHYTNFYGLSGIVSKKTIWCSKIQYLNDSVELTHGFEVLARVCSQDFSEYSVLSNLSERADRYRNINVFVCSLSEAGNLLSQWRGYSGGSGVSLEVSFEKLTSKAAIQGFALEKCVYDQTEKVAITKKFIEEFLKGRNSGLSESSMLDQIVSTFLPIAARFKHASFVEEQEWRLISQPIPFGPLIKVRPTLGGLVPYVEFDLKTSRTPLKSDLQPWRTNEDICITSVMVGPNREQELQMSAVGGLFDAHEAYVGSVGRSQIPLRML